jgi:hypothetical protein
MNAPWSHSTLHDFEAPRLSQDNVVCRNAYVLEDQVGVTMWRFVVAVHRQHALDLDALRD